MTWPYPEQQNKAQPSDEKERERERRFGTGSRPGQQAGTALLAAPRGWRPSQAQDAPFSQNSLMSEMVPSVLGYWAV